MFFWLTNIILNGKYKSNIKRRLIVSYLIIQSGNAAGVGESFPSATGITQASNILAMLPPRRAVIQHDSFSRTVTTAIPSL